MDKKIQDERNGQSDKKIDQDKDKGQTVVFT